MNRSMNNRTNSNNESKHRNVNYNSLHSVQCIHYSVYNQCTSF